MNNISAQSCRACGQTNGLDAYFCSRCGSKLPPMPAAAPTATGTPIYAYLLMGGLLFLIGMLGATLVLFGPRWLAQVRGGTPAGPPVSEPPRVAVVAEELPTADTPTDTATPEATATPEPTASSTPTPQATATAEPSATATAEPAVEPEPEWLVIGESAGGLPLEVLRVGNGPRKVLFVGGIHAGHSPSTVALAGQAADYFGANAARVPAGTTLYILISLNPDSPPEVGLRAGRLNAHGVDLNRNWDCEWTADADIEGHIVPGSGGPAPFSEPETRALRDFIMEEEMDAVIFWEARVANGYVSPGGCGVYTLGSDALAEMYGGAAGYGVGAYEAIDRPVPGDASNWLDAQGVPAVFVLLPDFRETDWEDNLAGMLAVIEG